MATLTPLVTYPGYFLEESTGFIFTGEKEGELTDEQKEIITCDRLPGDGFLLEFQKQGVLRMSGEEVHLCAMRNPETQELRRPTEEEIQYYAKRNISYVSLKPQRCLYRFVKGTEKGNYCQKPSCSLNGIGCCAHGGLLAGKLKGIPFVRVIGTDYVLLRDTSLVLENIPDKDFVVIGRFLGKESRALTEEEIEMATNLGFIYEPKEK